MIKKQTVFIDYNIQHVGCGVRNMARRLESELADLAQHQSMNENGQIPIFLMEEIFKRNEVPCYRSALEACDDFTLAAFHAHRTESILTAEMSDPHKCRYDRLKLCIRFFHKEQRKPFFEWSMTFVAGSCILIQSGTTGHGELGARVTAKR